MDTSQQPRDENKITHKNSLFLSWCILLALCFAFVSAAPAAAGPNPAKYDKAIRDMGQLQKSKKRLQREPWEKLAETFLTVYRVERKWKERSAALFRSAEALDHLARCASNAKDARRSVDRYLQLVRLYPKSSLADDSLYRAARLRGQILTIRPERKNCSNRSSKNTLLPIRPRTPPVTLQRSRPKKNDNRLPPPARQASKNSLEANRSASA